MCAANELHKRVPVLSPFFLHRYLVGIYTQGATEQGQNDSLHCVALMLHELAFLPGVSARMPGQPTSPFLGDAPAAFVAHMKLIVVCNRRCSTLQLYQLRVGIGQLTVLCQCGKGRGHEAKFLFIF